MAMTHKERVLGQINLQETDFVPYVLGFETEGVCEKGLDDYYGSDAWRGLIDNAVRYLPAKNPGFTFDTTAERTFTDLYGSTWRMDRRPWKLVEPALKEPSLDGLRIPSVDACFPADWEESVLRHIEEHQDTFLIESFGLGLFERTWALRGFENTMMDIVLHPDFYEALLERLTEHYLEVIDRILQLPFDGFKISDDWSYQKGVMVGIDRWRRFFKPRSALIYERVHQSGKVVINHICGSAAEILPELIEIGLDVYNSVQPEAKDNDPYTLKRKYGDRLTFWGGLGSQSTIPFGTPAEIKAEVAKLCREMGRGGGYILSGAKTIQPGTPVENAAAVLEAFLDQAGVAVP